MRTEEIEYLDGEFTVNEEEPNTLPEIVALIGENAVVDESINKLRYHHKYPRVYKKVSDAIVTEFPRSVKESKHLGDGTTKKIYVSNIDHLRNFLKHGGDDARVKLATLFAEIAPKEPLHVKGERGLGGRIGVAAEKSANLFFAQGDDIVEEKVKVIESLVPGYKVGRDADSAVTVDSLARGIQTANNHLKKQAQRSAEANVKAALGT